DAGETWTDAAAAGLPAGTVHFLHLLPDPQGGNPVLLAGVFGAGIHRSTDLGQSFVPLAEAPPPGLLRMFNPRAEVLPFGAAGDASYAWLAGLGGLFHSVDGGERWQAADLFSTGSVNVLFTAVATHEARVAAVAMLADAILPAEQQGALSGVLFLSEDGGESFIDASSDAPFQSPTGVVVTADAVMVSTLDRGTFELRDGSWSHLGGPDDAVGLALNEGGMDVASASRGLWRLEDEGWTQAGSGPIVAQAGDLALGHDGSIYRLEPGAGEAPAQPAGGTVHIALSFHTNLYHSYRGDTLDDDGFGMDLRVIRRILDWLDEYPNVKGDWDIENAFSLDGWLAEQAPDVVSRIAERRQRGQDGLRLMSWNNGAMAASTRHEFRAAVEWGLESYLDAFGSYDPGVQPQECMITPEHIGWYEELGIEWITLFNSASPFTALRPEVEISGAAAYQPLLLRGSLESDGEMIVVPVYHQADVLSHGGLLAWVKQISAAHPGDSLLVIHMDADAEVWESFDSAIADVYDLDFVRFTTIQEYLDSHEPSETIVLQGDLADGMDDAFQSWSEKNVNHELYTLIAGARRELSIAAALAEDDAQTGRQIDEAMEPMLLSLSTTHFGLASPELHPDRESSARAHIASARDAASAALSSALATEAIDPGEVLVVNDRPSAGTALVHIPLSLPAQDFQGTEGLRILDAEQELPALIETTDGEGEDGLVHLAATVVLEMDEGEQRRLRWSYDPSTPSQALGEVDPARLELAELVSLPFTECRGARGEAIASGSTETATDERGVRASRREELDVSLCEATGFVVRTFSVHDGLPGLVVDVEAELGLPARPHDSESVALTPLTCSSEATEITWQTFGGTVRSRPARRDVRVWNGQAVDGWLSMRCGDEVRQVAHHVGTRTSMAAYPLRNMGSAVLAPLGTLWGTPAWHDARGAGGHPIGDAAVSVVGAQFRPSAVDWAGKTVRYRLLIGEGEIPAGTLDLFAHPPAVFVGG
ncbi:MAG: hypothetical protein ACOCVR_00345, partial [Myxococcota bacterium]